MNICILTGVNTLRLRTRKLIVKINYNVVKHKILLNDYLVYIGYVNRQSVTLTYTNVVIFFSETNFL